MRTATVSIANDDADENPFTFAIQGNGGSDVVVTHSVETTSVNGSDGLVTPGEIITYRLQITLPDGTNLPLQVRAQYPEGTSYISGSSTVTPGGYGGTVGTVLVTNDTTNRRLTYSASYNTTADGNNANNTVIISYQVRVLDVASNSGLAGSQTTLTSTSTHNNGGANPGFTGTESSVDLTVVEPSLTVTNAAVVNGAGTVGDAGDTVRYTMVVSPTASATSNAYDVNLSNTLPTQLSSLTLVSAIVSDGATSTNVSGKFTVSGGTLSTTSTLNLLLNTNGSNDQRLTVLVQGTLNSSTQPGSTYSDTANVSYTSIAGADSDERTSTSSDTKTFTTPDASFAIALSSTDQAHTTGSNVTIGETVTYTATVTLPEGTTPDLSLVGVIPPGMQYVPGSASTDSAAFNGTVPVPSVSGGASDGADATITFGSISVTGDNVTGNNSFTVSFSARVLDVAGNSGGDTLNTSLTADIAADSAAAYNSSDVTVTVQEPVLTVTESVTEATASVGTPVTFVVSVQNSGTNASTAYETLVQIPLSATDFDSSSVSFGTAGTEYPTGYTPSVVGNTVTYTPDNGTTIAVGATSTFTFTVNLAATLNTSAVVTTSAATATTTTLPNSSAGERSATFTSGTDTVTTLVSTVTITATDASANENTAGAGGEGIWRVQRSGSVGDVTVQLEVDATSTASAADWTQSGATFSSLAPGTTGTVLIPDGSTYVDITLAPINDDHAEADETVKLNVAADAAYVVGGTSSATVTIAANDFVVINTNDSGEGSLRQAVLNANSIAGDDTITFDGGTFTDATVPDVITLTSGHLTINSGSGTTIQGPGADKLTLSADNNSRHFQVQSLATLSGMTLTAGNSGTANGGAIHTSASRLTLIGMQISGNTASGAGGGIYVESGSNALSMINCTLSGNSAVGTFDGGGIQLNGSGSSTLVNCTISNNTATNTGGGIRQNGGPLTITNCTITDNTSTSGGSGIDASAIGNLTVANTILAGSKNNESKPDTAGSFTSAGGNFIGNSGTATGFTNGADNDQVGNFASFLNPYLAPLANNGGPTQTHRPLEISPVINGGLSANLPVDTYDLDEDGDTAETLSVDQRGLGYARVNGFAVDIGSVEGIGYTPTITNATTDEDTQTTSGLVITANASDGGSTTHYKITNILNGRLYKNNGTTEITSGTFITKAEGALGLKFTPGANLNDLNTATGFHFDAQATTDGADTGLQPSVATATITVNAVVAEPLDLSRRLVDGRDP